MMPFREVLSREIGAAVVALSMATASSASTLPTGASGLGRDSEIVARFLQSIGDYLRSPVADAVDLDALCLPADAYTAAAVHLDVRPPVREGDFFTGDVAELFRRWIAGSDRAGERAGWRPSTGTRAAAAAAGPPVVVGERLQPAAGTALPAWLLATLPPLPEGVAYRGIAGHLVLVDLRGNLVIDVLREWRRS